MSLHERLRAAALAYASHGQHVLPLRVGDKVPATGHGLNDATSHLAIIATWWRARPFNIGIRTGRLSGFFVVDIDPGGDLMGLIPTVETGRGWQVWFETHLQLPSTAGRLGPHIDTRGEGGYVVAPPSIHPNGKSYRFCHQGWIDGDLPILASPPDWLIDRLRKPTNSERALGATKILPLRTPSGGAGGAYGRAALDAEIRMLERAAKGTRNHALNRAAFCLGQLVAGGELAEAEVVTALISASECNGLMADDGWPSVRRTLLSGLTAGMKQPRGRAT